MNSPRPRTSTLDDLESKDTPGSIEDKAQKEAQEIVNEKLTPRQKKVADEITKWFAFAGVALVQTDAYDGMLILKTSAQHAELIVKAARHDKRVFDVLERMTQSSDMIALASFEGIFLYALMAHHGRIPANKPMLQQFGYSEEQILEVPPAPEAQDDTIGTNGYAATRNPNIPV
jgi:hypothetical protein